MLQAAGIEPGWVAEQQQQWQGAIGDRYRVMAEDDTLAALDALPDDALRSIIAACTDTLLRHIAVPKLGAVSGIGRLCKDLRRQLYRLRPLVGVHVRSLTVAQRLRRWRSTRGPWEVVFLHMGDATAVVVEQARRGRVLSIDAHGTTLAPDVASRVIPELLGAGCSLRALGLSHVNLNGSWASIFGEAAVSSGELRELQLDGCQLSGPLPELNLPKLQVLFLSRNRLMGSLEPLKGCTALRELDVSHNRLTGTLETLKSFTFLQGLDASHNLLNGGLEPLGVGCVALQELFLSHNRLTGSLEPLKSCTSALRKLDITHNQLVGTLEPLSCMALQRLDLTHNLHLTGSLDPLMGCTALQELALGDNSLSGSLEPLRNCTRLRKLHVTNNQLTLSGGVEPLAGCKALQGLALSGNCELSTGLGMFQGCTALRKVYLRYDLRHGYVHPRKLVRIHPLVIVLARRVQSWRQLV